jgi:HlyD family secretion protein
MLDAQLMRARATLAKAQAERGRAQLNVAHAQMVLQRTRKLAQDAMTAQAEEQSAKLAYDGALAALRSSDATVQEAQADMDTATLSRKLATLVSPINGVIIDRQIEVGQTVAAQFQVATLFTIAQTMNEVVVLAAIDEADMGRVRLGMPVTFAVDAYPGRTFAGTLETLRPAPVGFGAPAGADGALGVVTYLAEIGASNGDRALWEGMTAQVHIEIQMRPQVVRVPAAALRFRPEAGAEPPERPGHPEVFVRTAGGKVVARAVQLGLTDGAYWEIVSGLEGTEEVAVAQGRTKSAPRGRRGPF